MTSALRVEGTKLDGVLQIHPPTQHEDFRGDYVETYNANLYRAAGISDAFVQDDYSTSYRHVLRGIHGDHSTVKLISCLFGSIYVIAVSTVAVFHTLGDQSSAGLYPGQVRELISCDV